MEGFSGKSKPIITLTTDFGLKDPFVGTMKGVMLKINPDLTIVDLTHEIEPHNVLEAALVLGSAYRYFPKDTTHLVVVDPGVGSDRRPILVLTDNYSFVSPDNGVLSLIFKDPEFKGVFELREKRYFLDKISDTFHGRDIFAPVASWLSRGVKASELGGEIDDYASLPIPEPEVSEGRIKGSIVYIDRFGNLISNITRELFNRVQSASSKRGVEINLGSQRIRKINRYYAEGEKERASALFNSWGNLEIYLPEKSAEKGFRIKKGKEITVNFI